MFGCWLMEKTMALLYEIISAVEINLNAVSDLNGDRIYGNSTVAIHSRIPEFAFDDFGD